MTKPGKKRKKHDTSTAEPTTTNGEQNRVGRECAGGRRPAALHRQPPGERECDHHQPHPTGQHDRNCHPVVKRRVGVEAPHRLPVVGRARRVAVKNLGEPVRPGVGRQTRQSPRGRRRKTAASASTPLNGVTQRETGRSVSPRRGRAFSRGIPGSGRSSARRRTNRPARPSPG